MTTGLLELLGLPEINRPDAGPQTGEFAQAFRAGIAVLNQAMQVMADQAEHQKLDTQRQKLYEAYQNASVQGDPAKNERVMAALTKFQEQASSQAAIVTASRDDWLKRQTDFDASLVKISELEDAGHPKAGTTRQVIQGIRDLANSKLHQKANSGLDQLLPKVNLMYTQHLQQAGPGDGEIPGGGETGGGGGGGEETDEERIKKLKEWQKSRSITGNSKGLQEQLRDKRNKPVQRQAREEFNKIRESIARGEVPDVAPREVAIQQRGVSESNRISTANKGELENSPWLKKWLPDPEGKLAAEYMKWLEKGHDQGDTGKEIPQNQRGTVKHDHYRPGSPAAEAKLLEWLSEQNLERLKKYGVTEKYLKRIRESNENLHASPETPVSMRLPDELNRPVKAKEMDNYNVTDETDDEAYRNAEAVRDQLRQEVLQQSGIALTRAVTYSTKFSVQVSQACEAFKRYSKPKIKELQDKIKANDIFGPIVVSVLGVVAGKLGEKIGKGLDEIGTKLAKEVFDKIKDGLQEKFVKGVESKLVDSSDLEALEKGVEDMIKSANDFATHVASEVDKTIVVRLREIENAAKKGTKLSLENGALIKPFLDGDTDDLLESYGVPSPKTAEAIQVEIFRGLVQKFEEKRIVAQSWAAGGSVRSGIEMGTVRHNAKRYADEAAKERGADILKENAKAST